MVSLIVKKDLDDLSLIAVERFLAIIRDLSQNNSEIYVGLSGGSSVKNFYENIIFLSSELDKENWRKLRFCFVDERVVSLDSSDSNYRQCYDMLFKELIKKKLITEKQILKINADSENVAQDYNSKVKRIDIAILGSGEDGHTCSLFPNHEILEKSGKKFELVTNSPKPPAKRVTITFDYFKDIKYSFLFFIGEGKKTAYLRFLDTNLGEREVPVKFAKQSKELLIYTNILL